MSKGASELSSEPSLKFNFVMNLIVTCSSIVFPLITFPYVTRMLLADAYGSVMFAQSVATYFSLFAVLGVGTYGIRLVARLRDDPDALARAVSEVITIILCATVIVCLIFAGCVVLVPRFRAEYLLLAIFGISIVLNTLGVTWIYAGLENYRYIAIVTLVTQTISLVAVFLFVHNPDDAFIYALILVFSAGACQLFNFFHAFKYVRIRIPVRPRLREHLGPMLAFFLISASTSIYLNLDTVMLGFMDSDTAVGYYTAAVKIKSVLTSVTVSLGSVVLPRASYLLEQGDEDKFKELNVKVARFVQLFSIPLCAFCIVFAQPIILILSGEGFAGATMPLRVIMPAIVFIGLTNVLGLEILVPMGRERDVALSTLAAAIIDFALNILLIPLWSATGAAFSTSLAEIGVFILQMFMLRHFLKGAHLFRGLWKVLIASLVAFTLPALVLIFVPWSEIVTFLIAIPLYFGSYLGLMISMRDPLIRELLGSAREIGAKLRNRA